MKKHILFAADIPLSLHLASWIQERVIRQSSEKRETFQVIFQTGSS
jgi:hypothetical protein